MPSYYQVMIKIIFKKLKFIRTKANEYFLND